MVFATAATRTPKLAKPKPVTKPMNGTSSKPTLGEGPNAIATISGATP